MNPILKLAAAAAVAAVATVAPAQTSSPPGGAAPYKIGFVNTK